jgi:serine/threonine-protein kinase RsbW
MMDEFHVSLSPRLSAVRSLSRMVEEFGDANRLPHPKIYMINLALDELITNSVTYGFGGVADPKIEVTVRIDGDTLVLTTLDNGRRFDPTAAESPDLDAPVEKRPIGGLGLHIVKTFADRVVYKFEDGRNRLTLEHDLNAPSPQGGRPSGEEHR